MSSLEASLSQRLQPNWILLACGTSAVAGVSFAFLPWPHALISVILGVLMIAGADIDARSFLLPDFVTYGATVCGIFSAPFLSDAFPGLAVLNAALRTLTMGLSFALLRYLYMHLRGREGLGLGDVKLAAAIGAWLPLESIPYCLGLASVAALIATVFLQENETTGETKLPFGAFLCPALWLIFFLNFFLAEGFR